MAEQKKEALEKDWQDEMALPSISLSRRIKWKWPTFSPDEVKAFRDKTRPVYDKWAGEIGIELVRSAEHCGECKIKHVRYWPKADIASAPHMSAFGGKADMTYCSKCPLMTQSGHSNDPFPALL